MATQTETMRAAIYRGPNDAAVVEKPKPTARDGWAIIAPEFFGVCGTDLHIWQGHHPRAQPGLTLGHEFVGRLTESNAIGEAGTAVFVNPLIGCGECRSCLEHADHVCAKFGLFGIDVDGGAAEFVSVPMASLVPLPEGVDLRSFALIEPASVCVRAVRRSRQRLGDTVRVVGAGPIGLMVALCARQAGAASVTIAEPSELRAATARALGFEVTETSPREQFDVVYDCTGHPSVAPHVLDLVLTGGTLVDVGLYRAPIAIDLPSVMRRELTIVGTHVYRPADVRGAIDLIASGQLPVERLVSSIRPLDEIQLAFEQILEGNEVKVLLSPRPLHASESHDSGEQS
ncbi:zinc-dependent alcohol dehydrogenase [Humidisolicoccus flavus]|uniref:zinc-dependent alcohol dehydrogenase n=1 Tax=Humidisolicoccus flavus TaxID=3111414 RepID=UPI00324C082F